MTLVRLYKLPGKRVKGFSEHHCTNNAILYDSNRIYDGVEAETRKSQAFFQIIQVSSEALPRMRLNAPRIRLN